MLVVKLGAQTFGDLATAVGRGGSPGLVIYIA